MERQDSPPRDQHDPATTGPLGLARSDLSMRDLEAAGLTAAALRASGLPSSDADLASCTPEGRRLLRFMTLHSRQVLGDRSHDTLTARVTLAVSDATFTVVPHARRLVRTSTSALTTRAWLAKCRRARFETPCFHLRTWRPLRPVSTPLLRRS